MKIEFRVIFGAVAAIMAALKLSKVSNKINTAFVERQNGTDRGRNGRKTRKTYCFSKDWDIHDAVTYFTMYTYNFCWPVRTLRQQGPDGQWLPQTPAMAAGLTDHVWSLWEWLTFPTVQHESDTRRDTVGYVRQSATSSQACTSAEGPLGAKTARGPRIGEPPGGLRTALLTWEGPSCT